MKLTDWIIENGPFIGGDRIPNAWRFPDYVALNEMRDELIELRAVVAKVENDQCGCLGGPLTIEWARGGA